MTIEEEFFKAFGIEKQHIILEDDYGQYRTRDKMYPKITAEKLLQLICIANNYPLNREILKNEVLEKLLFLESNKFTRDDIRPQVRKLFEE